MSNDKGKPTIGIWIDDPPKKVATPAYFDALQACNIGLVDLMADTSSKGWDPKYTTKILELIGRLAADRGIAVALTTWPDPAKEWIKAMTAGVVDLINACGAQELCQDSEHNWLLARVMGFRTPSPGSRRSPLDLAGDYLVDRLHEVKAKTGVRLSLSSYTSHAEHGPAADVAPHMDLVLPQAYSVRNRMKRNPTSKKWDVPWEVPWGHLYGPGNMVRHTLDRASTIPGVEEGRVELGVGLACYDQVWPGHTAAEAMIMSLIAAVDRGCRHVRFWSSKWAIGVRKNPYAEDFLRSIPRLI